MNWLRTISVTGLPARRAGVLKSCVLGFAVAVVTLGGNATETRAGERVPFSFTNSLQGEFIVQCSGPWGRESKRVGVDFEKTKTFYTAEQTIFTMFGAWSCDVCAVNFCQEGPPEDVFFCLNKDEGDQAPVELILTSEGALTVNYPGEPATGDCSATSATATLGDNPSRSGVDRDSYLLDGRAGDALTLRVAGDNMLGHQGDLVELRLTRKGGKFRRKLSGPVPLTLGARLPKDGTYRVEVRPAGKKKANLGSGESGPLRGAYQLSVENDGGVETLIPTSDVEP